MIFFMVIYQKCSPSIHPPSTGSQRWKGRLHQIAAVFLTSTSSMIHMQHHTTTYHHVIPYKHVPGSSKWPILRWLSDLSLWLSDLEFMAEKVTLKNQVYVYITYISTYNLTNIFYVGPWWQSSVGFGIEFFVCQNRCFFLVTSLLKFDHHSFSL